MRRALALLLPALLGCALDPLAAPASDAGSGDSGSGGSGGSPDAGCTSASACDDGNPCTIDQCEGGMCSHTPASMGTSCPTADPCDEPSTCDGQGQCQTGAPIPVDDGNPCTTGACDPTTGAISHTPIPGCVNWIATPSTGAPLPREYHTAVWTGSKMIVWGGSVTGMPPVTATGALYDPAAKTWTPTSLTGAPPPRFMHVAVWTGSKMIVWGGYGATSYETTGGIYDPVADQWLPMSTTNAPEGRTDFTGVWTGSQLLVFGGTEMGALGDGGAYDPETDVWTALPAAGAPSPREDHTAVWAGDRMIVWGGTDTFNWLQTGAEFDPVAGAWTATSLTGAPPAVQYQTAVWTGSAMLVWGGWNGGPDVNTGGSFDPLTGAQGTWTAITTTGAPSVRQDHTAVWIGTGNGMMIWGGCGADDCTAPVGDGGFWTPGDSGGTWAPIAVSAELGARHRHTAVWTGTEVVVWGGRTSAGLTATGAQAIP
jgi:hypothetical protein